MTKYGQLYNYGFDGESPRWNWKEVDKVLCGESFSHNDWNPLVTIPKIMAMVQEQFEVPLQNIWRVHVKNDGMVEINDFTMPSNKDTMRESVRQEDLPLWIQDSLSVLMIVDEGVTVEGLGKKISDSIFYVVETPEIKESYGDEARSKGKKAD